MGRGNQIRRMAAARAAAAAAPRIAVIFNQKYYSAEDDPMSQDSCLWSVAVQETCHRAQHILTNFLSLKQHAPVQVSIIAWLTL